MRPESRATTTVYKTANVIFPSRGVSFHIFHISIFTLLFLPASTVSYISYFILVVPMRKCLGKHSCMSSTVNIAVLNGTGSRSSLSDNVGKIWNQCAVKLNSIITSYNNVYILWIIRIHDS